MQNILEEVSKTCIDMLMRGDPFFAHIASSLNRQVVEDKTHTATLGVGLSGNMFTLFINAEYWTNVLTNPNHRRGIFKHEMLHIVFKHLFVHDPALDRKLLDIAFDLVVNQYIDRSLLPEDSIFLDSFPDMRFQSNQTWFYYYKKLEELQQKQQNGAPGNPSQDMLNGIQGDSHGLDRHQQWRDLRNLSELEKSVLDTHADALLKTAHQRTSSTAWGNLPGSIQDAIKNLLVKPETVVDWRLMVKIFSESAYKTRIKNTLKRPSKRYGTSPGIKVRRKQRLMVAVDTSGSVGQDDMDSFFAEIFHLWRTGADVEIVECDTKVQRHYPYKGATPAAVWGRGGTDFNEPLALANREKPDGLIYFTDGYAGQPNIVPRMPVLWVITQRGLAQDNQAYINLPGRKVKMKK